MPSGRDRKLQAWQVSLATLLICTTIVAILVAWRAFTVAAVAAFLAGLSSPVVVLVSGALLSLLFWSIQRIHRDD